MRRALHSSPHAFQGAAPRAVLAMALLALAIQVGACGANGATDGSGPNAGAGGSGGSGATGGTAGQTARKLTLKAFSTDGLDVVDPARLVPSEMVRIVATATPADGPDIRFGLLDAAGGSPLDATLDLVEVTPEGGVARVVLTAPSTPTTFSVRASAVGYPTALLDFSVRRTDLAKLSVSPMCSEPTAPGCPGGGRTVESYVVSVWQDRTCADLPPGDPPEDGALTAMSAVDMIAPVNITVPAGVPLAVVLRSSKFAWGCTMVDAATEGPANDVSVVMTNVPLTFDTSDLEFTLSLDSFEPLDAALAAPEQALLASVLGTATDDVEALLDAMAAEHMDPPAFDATRGTESWDDYLRGALGSQAIELLQRPLRAWIETGLAELHGSPGLVGELKGAPGEPTPTLTLSSVLGLTPARSGFKPLGAPTWQAATNDSVLIGMGMQFEPATLLLGAARAPALAEITDATSLAQALAKAARCDVVADTLVSHGETADNSSGACDLACTKALCVKAVATLLATADLPSDTPATLDVALTAAGTVGDDAELVAFHGTWLGRLLLTEAGDASNLTGSADASTVAPPAK